MSHQAATTGRAIDPVCGMEVVLGSTDIITTIDERRYYFCAEGCRKAFEQNPKKFLEPKPAKRKGPWGRYLDRLQKCTGGKGMKCH
jgi:YHS domain-containing protein